MHVVKNHVSLPDELWLIILEWVAFVPNAFDVHAPDLFAYPAPWSQEQIQKGIRDSLLTKRRVVRVCKAWNSLAAPLLYSAISIIRKTTLDRLLRTLAERNESEIWKARWTLRLDIAIKSREQLPADDFMALLRYLPDIQIIVSRTYLFSFARSLADVSLLDLLAVARQNALLGSLHVLDCHSIHDPKGPDNLDCIDGLPLRVLRIRPPVLSLWLGKRITLPEIELLDVPPQLLRSVFSGETPVPTLEQLCIEKDYDAIWKIVRGDLSGIGGRVRTLEIDDSDLFWEDALYARRPMSSAFFREVARSCPNLENLIVNSGGKSLVYMTGNPESLPAIRRLGLRFNRKDKNGKEWIKHICSEFSGLAAALPSLEVIRLLGRPTLAELQNHHAGSLKIIQRFSRSMLSDFGVRFEDWTGQIFHDVD